VDDAWTAQRDIYCTTAAETLRKRARTQKDWLSPSTWNYIEERRELNHSIMNCRSEGENRQRMYQMKDKEVKKRARADKRRTLEKVAEETEKAAHQNNLKELYMKTNLLRGCLKKLSTGTRTKGGKVHDTSPQGGKCLKGGKSISMKS